MNKHLITPNWTEPLVNQQGYVLPRPQAFLEALARVGTSEVSGGEDRDQLLAHLQSEGRVLAGALERQTALIADLTQLLHHQSAQEMALLGRIAKIEKDLADLNQLMAAAANVS